MRQHLYQGLKQDDRGSLMVETTLSFVLFVGVLASILSIINLVTLHDRIQYALTQTATELSAYSYLYEATGLKGSHDSWKDHADAAKGDLNAIIEGIGTLAGTPDNLTNAGSLGELGDAVEDAWNAGETIWNEASHPLQLVQKMVSGGLDELLEGGKSLLLEGISSEFSKKYLMLDASAVGGEQMNADTYLRSFGVVDGIKGLDFSESTIFSDQKTIDIVVQYDVNYKFVMLPLPFTKIHMVQRAATSGWCGDGERYE